MKKIRPPEEFRQKVALVHFAATTLRQTNSKRLDWVFPYDPANALSLGTDTVEVLKRYHKEPFEEICKQYSENGRKIQWTGSLDVMWMAQGCRVKRDRPLVIIVLPKFNYDVADMEILSQPAMGKDSATDPPPTTLLQTLEATPDFAYQMSDSHEQKLDFSEGDILLFDEGEEIGWKAGGIPGIFLQYVIKRDSDAETAE